MKARYEATDGSWIEYSYDERGPWWTIQRRMANGTRHGLQNNISCGSDQEKAWGYVLAFVELKGKANVRRTM